MCLVALALARHARFPFVIAANRDEFHERPTEPLAWGDPDGGTGPVLSGRDLSGGGMWMGLTPGGRRTATGLPQDAERRLSSAFVRMPERGYATRSSTVLVTEHVEGRELTHVFERTFEHDPATPPRLRQVTLDDWPPAELPGFDERKTQRPPVLERELS